MFCGTSGHAPLNGVASSTTAGTTEGLSSMAKRRREQFVNRRRVRASFGANATTIVATEITTNMITDTANPYKWVVLGATMQPEKNDDIPALADSTLALTSQLCIGSQTAELNGNHTNLIASLKIGMDVGTSGGPLNSMVYPFDIMYPLPLYCKTITWLMDGANTATLNSTDWFLTIYYVTAGISDDEMREYLQAYGTEN